MLSAGAALLQRPDWARIQGGSLICFWKLSWGLLTEHLGSPPHGLSPCCLGFLRDSKRYHYTTSLLPHSNTKIYQDQLNSRRREKDCLLMTHHSIQIHHIHGAKTNQSFIVGALIPLLSRKHLSSVDSIPTETRGTDSLLLDLLQGRNRVRTSHITQVGF